MPRFCTFSMVVCDTMPPLQGRRPDGSACYSPSSRQGWLVFFPGEFPLHPPLPTMANRVAKGSKRDSSSTQRRKDLARDISFFGIDMLPCSSCEANNLKNCRALDRSAKCNNCLELGRPDCDVHGLTRALSASFRRQKERLDKEEEEANATILQAASKLARLRSQRATLSERFQKAASREEQIIESLEREEILAALSSQSAGPSGVQEFVIPLFLIMLRLTDS